MAADREDFEAFVAARYDALLRTAYLLTGDHHDAEDLLQQTLVKAVGAWSRITGDPEPYVRTILVRQNVSRWRRRRWREVSTDTPRDTPITDDGAEERLVLHRALGVLAPAAARRDRAALLRGPDRGADRGRPRDLGRHREVPGSGRAAETARDRAGAGRGARFALIAPVGWLRFPGADRHPATADRQPRHQAHPPGGRRGRGHRLRLPGLPDPQPEASQGRRPEQQHPGAQGGQDL